MSGGSTLTVDLEFCYMKVMKPCEADLSGPNIYVITSDIPRSKAVNGDTDDADIKVVSATSLHLALETGL